MQVILLERVAKLGQMGDVVSVKDGYARNYLFPQKKALWASETNLKAFDAEKAQLEARNLETKTEAEGLAERLNGQQFIVIRSASDAGSLYGSVTPRDAADAATEAGFSVDKRQVALMAPIKELGMHSVSVTLHPEVDAEIQLNVACSEEEAELQERFVFATKTQRRPPKTRVAFSIWPQRRALLKLHTCVVALPSPCRTMRWRRFLTPRRRMICRPCPTITSAPPT